MKDAAGRRWTSSELLDCGPLVLALFRGGWCPYCDLTMVALEEARPAIEALGGQAIGIMPDLPEHVATTARQRGIGYTLLSDPANGYARTCGLAYELSPNHIRIHRERGRDFPGCTATPSGACRCRQCSWCAPTRGLPSPSPMSIRRAGPIRRS